MHAQDLQFGQRTWTNGALSIDGTYTGSTKERFQEFMRSATALPLTHFRLPETVKDAHLHVDQGTVLGWANNQQSKLGILTQTYQNAEGTS